MKKETRNRIIKWSLFGILFAAAIVITVFSNQIFGFNHHKVLDEYGNLDGKTYAWDIEPLFNSVNTGNAFTNYFLKEFILHSLRTIQIAGFAIAFAIVLHYLARIVFRSKRGKTISR